MRAFPAYLRRSASTLDDLSALDSATSDVRSIAGRLVDRSDPWAGTIARAWWWLPTWYVAERDGDRWQRSAFTMKTGTGDCEDWAVLLAALLKAAAIDARIATLPQHVVVAVRVPDDRMAAPAPYRAIARTAEGWEAHWHLGQAWLFLESTLSPWLRAGWWPGALAGHVAMWANTPFLQIANARAATPA